MVENEKIKIHEIQDQSVRVKENENSFHNFFFIHHIKKAEKW